jgi:hypothetical protein
VLTKKVGAQGAVGCSRRVGSVRQAYQRPGWTALGKVQGACNRVLDDERHAHVRLPQSRDHLRENPRGRTDDKRLSLDSLEPATHLVVDPAGVDDDRQQFTIRDDDDRLRPIW